jgi:hypothetical protein
MKILFRIKINSIKKKKFLDTKLEMQIKMAKKSDLEEIEMEKELELEKIKKNIKMLAFGINSKIEKFKTIKF